MIIHEQVPLAPLTTLGVGGPARYFAEADSESDVREALQFAESHHVPHFVLGGGSNLLVSDRGFDGLVLKIALRGIEQVANEDDRVVFSVAAGENWDDFVARAVEEDLGGVECLSGIPRLRRRNSSPECRRLRPGSIGDDSRGHGARSSISGSQYLY